MAFHIFCLIGVAISILKYSTRAIMGIPTLLIFPLLWLASVISYLVLWVIGYLVLDQMRWVVTCLFFFILCFSRHCVIRRVFSDSMVMPVFYARNRKRVRHVPPTSRQIEEARTRHFSRKSGVGDFFAECKWWQILGIFWVYTGLYFKPFARYAREWPYLLVVTYALNSYMPSTHLCTLYKDYKKKTKRQNDHRNDDVTQTILLYYASFNIGSDYVPPSVRFSRSCTSIIEQEFLLQLGYFLLALDWSRR